MDVNFKTIDCECLNTAVQEIRSTELTQEIKIPDSMPDIGRVVAAWGQAILRSKEWNRDSFGTSAGLMVWVLYTPEDGSQEQCLETWIPFQMKWELPEDTPQGDLRIRFFVRFVDGRSVSPRKIMIRAGVAALGEAYVPMSLQLYAPDEVNPSVEMLRSNYPMRLMKEAGEKDVVFDEELQLPDAAPKPDQMIYYRLEPRVTDKKVLSNKMVFRGNANLHMLYRSEEGQVHSWDFDLPFSQYTELQGEYGADAQTDLVLTPTGSELELTDEGILRFKGGMAAQYLITDRQSVELVEDAYSPGREARVHMRTANIPVILENRRENMYAEQMLPVEANTATDVAFFTEYPRQRRGERGVEILIPGTFQVLYYDEGGALRAVSGRWEGQQQMNAHENSRLLAIPQYSQPQAAVGSGQILAKTDLPIDVTTSANQQIPMVTGVELGEKKQPEMNRPALILRRAGEQRLWDIAKNNGSTVDTIRRVNGLQEEPAAEQMLLIPVS